MRLLAAWVAASLTTLMATGNEFILSSDGSMTLQGSLGTALTGTLIGDWDEVSNPDGTRTLPGVWGGSGNNPIPIDLTLTIDFDGDSVPAGPLTLTLDPKTSSATITGLDWTVLPETVLSATVTGTVLYETFRTAAPDSLYPGGIPVDIPLGEATVSDVTILQTASAVGAATPIDGQPGAHDILVPVPAMVSMVVSSETIGELPMEFPIILTIDGVHQVGDATDMLIMAVESILDESSDLPNEPLPTIPIEMPTVLPPGDETAGILLNLTPTSVSAQLAINADLTAAHQQSMPGDVNGDGLVNTDDLLAVLGAWGPCAPTCPEDFDGDGLVGVNDVLILIGAWSA
jgi:hypothetical protein